MSLTAFISFRHAIAYVVVIVFLWIPIDIYCDYRSLLGGWPTIKLLAIAGAGGSIAFALFVEGKDRLLALVPGCVAGIGAVSAYIYLLAPLDRCPGLARPTHSAMLMLLGAVPGFLLMWLLVNKRREPS